MKILRLLFILTVMLTAVLFVGCKSTPSEKDIKKDLLNYEDEDFFEISKVTIDRELTEEKKDVIDCTVETSNEFADMIFYLTIDYTKYDTGGWQIDSIVDRKDYAVTITDKPSNDSVETEVAKIMQGEGISDYSVIETSFDKATGDGAVEVQAFVEDDTYIKYYKDMIFNCCFDRGYWNISYENTGDDVKYALIKDTIVGKTFSGDDGDDYDPSYAQLTFTKVEGNTVYFSYILKYIKREVEWGTGKETLTLYEDDAGDAVVATEFENPTLTGPHYYGSFEADYWTDPYLIISNEKIHLREGSTWIELNEGELDSKIKNVTGSSSTNSFDEGVTESNSSYDGYIIPESNVRIITEDDLLDLTSQELTYARNEIYARHGYVFKSSELNNYFLSTSWYVTDELYDGSLSDIERTNANFISEYQKSNGLEYAPQ